METINDIGKWGGFERTILRLQKKKSASSIDDVSAVVRAYIFFIVAYFSKQFFNVRNVSSSNMARKELFSRV